jgi:hypothetical protein
MNPTVYYLQNSELRNLRYEFSKITRFLLFPSISKITGNIPENIPLTGQRSTAGQSTIWTVRGIQRIRATLAILTAVRTRRAMAVQTTAVAAAPTVPRPGGGGGEVRRAAATPLAVSSAALTLPSRIDVDSGELLAAVFLGFPKGKGRGGRGVFIDAQKRDKSATKRCDFEGD